MDDAFHRNPFFTVVVNNIEASRNDNHKSIKQSLEINNGAEAPLSLSTWRRKKSQPIISRHLTLHTVVFKIYCKFSDKCASHIKMVRSPESPFSFLCLKAATGYSAYALELLILTATRTSEAIETKWSEFDLEAKVWATPAARMKTGKEHREPKFSSEIYLNTHK